MEESEGFEPPTPGGVVVFGTTGISQTRPTLRFCDNPPRSASPSPTPRFGLASRSACAPLFVTIHPARVGLPPLGVLAPHRVPLALHFVEIWSGWEDLNLRSLVPKTSGLPGFPTPRKLLRTFPPASNLAPAIQPCVPSRNCVRSAPVPDCMVRTRARNFLPPFAHLR